ANTMMYKCSIKLSINLRYVLLFSFFNVTAPTEFYTLSLHDALPICGDRRAPRRPVRLGAQHGERTVGLVAVETRNLAERGRSFSRLSSCARPLSGIRSAAWSHPRRAVSGADFRRADAHRSDCNTEKTGQLSCALGDLRQGGHRTGKGGRPATEKPVRV